MSILFLAKLKVGGMSYLGGDRRGRGEGGRGGGRCRMRLYVLDDSSCQQEDGLIINYSFQEKMCQRI